MTNTFCPVPWIFQAPRANGDIRICCQANNSPTAGIVRKEDGTPYNADRDDLTLARNAELMKTVRKNMLEGIWSDECIRCQREEQNNEYSRRMYELDNWDYTVDDAMRETVDGVIYTNVTPIQYYDFRFGNKCNLACRMCGPTDSDYWYDDWIKLRGTNEFHDNGGETIRIGVDNPYDWHSNENFWEQIEANIDNIRYIYFAGGEPMLIQRHYDFLEKCIELDNAKNMIIEYNTNMTTLPPRVINLWKSFKEVRVGASIDGYGEVFEYQRYPAKWDKVYKNLKKLDTLDVTCWISYTVSVYNAEHLIDFIDWFEREKFKRIELKHHMVYGPPHLNVKALPMSYKNTIGNKYRLNRHKYKKKHREILVKVNDFMFSEDYHSQYGKYMQEFTEKLDTIRNQDISNTVPLLEKHTKGID